MKKKKILISIIVILMLILICGIIIINSNANKITQIQFGRIEIETIQVDGYIPFHEFYKIDKDGNVYFRKEGGHVGTLDTPEPGTYEDIFLKQIDKKTFKKLKTYIVTNVRKKAEGTYGFTGYYVQIGDNDKYTTFECKNNNINDLKKILDI